MYSLKAALQADPTWNGQKNRFEGTPDEGFYTFTQIYASWAASQAYYKQEVWKTLPNSDYTCLEDYIARGWEAGYRKRDPHNLLAMIDTWLQCDISDNPVFRGDLGKAFASIQAKCLIMPAETDLYFPPEDCQAEANMIANSQFLPIPSIWGHRAGNPYQNPQDEAFLRTAVHEFLDA